MAAEPDELLRHAGTQIRHARKAAGLSQQELAEMIGMARASVANLEAGRQDMSVTRLAGIAAVLGLDFTAVFPASMLPPLPPAPHNVAIRRVYMVVCETCDSLLLDAPAERAKAGETRRDHIAAKRLEAGRG